MEETICAISTSLGVGAISIIRVSGEDAINIVNGLFKGKDLNKVDSHTINYGFIVDKGSIIDEVLISIMKAPRTFTMEDVVEINCHGGIAPTNKILELLLTNGCRLAEPGEFTKRAFLNGRIDLVEAEAISDLIESSTDKARDLAVKQVTGELSKLIISLREEIMGLLANIEVNIDFPEYDDALEITNEILIPKIKEIKDKMNNILAESNNAKIIKDGIDVSIIGRPNVGKSSLLNTLLEEDKAIVTNIAGTTRDIVEGSLILSGIKLNFIDTAGIRETEDIIEKLGIDKSRQMIESSDLVILLLNNNEEFSDDDKQLLDLTKNKETIIFINKCDLENKLKLDGLDNVILGSTFNKDGIVDLKNKIIEIFSLEKIVQNDMTYLTNARQISLIKKSINKLEEIEELIHNETPIEFLTIDLKQVWDYIGEIIGATYKDELLDELFSKFCLGK